MNAVVADSAGMAFNLAGWVEGGLQRGYLSGAPDWWVDGIRERLDRMDALSAQANARLVTRLARLAMQL